MNTLIEIKNLYAGYEGKSVIKDATLNIYENDFLGIIGPNGGGKTTLIKVILGLLHPQKGEISYYRNSQSVKEIKMGYLPQYNSQDGTRRTRKAAHRFSQRRPAPTCIAGQSHRLKTRGASA